MNRYDSAMSRQMRKTTKKALLKCGQKLCGKVFLIKCSETRPRVKGNISWLPGEKKYETNNNIIIIINEKKQGWSNSARNIYYFIQYFEMHAQCLSLSGCYKLWLSKTYTFNIYNCIQIIRKSLEYDIVKML